eukprot:scaffold303243_cov30-Tisochrysis_lutea.AAC.2
MKRSMWLGGGSSTAGAMSHPSASGVAVIRRRAARLATSSRHSPRTSGSARAAAQSARCSSIATRKWPKLMSNRWKHRPRRLRNTDASPLRSAAPLAPMPSLPSTSASSPSAWIPGTPSHAPESRSIHRSSLRSQSTASSRLAWLASLSRSGTASQTTIASCAPACKCASHGRGARGSEVADSSIAAAAFAICRAAAGASFSPWTVGGGGGSSVASLSNSAPSALRAVAGLQSAYARAAAASSSLFGTRPRSGRPG